MRKSGVLICCVSLLTLSIVIPASLTPQERLLLRLRFSEQLSYRELGARFGISEGACRIKLFRTIEKCRKEYDRP